ncbi:MAG: leucine-rich repeat protein, partial [Clostridia bacterium]|nr:leucine-rich repeat protein [Clostridia bacterium]
TLTIGENVKTVAENLFYGYSMNVKKIIFNATRCKIASIGSASAMPVIKATEVIIGENVKQIPAKAFRGCLMTGITIPEGVESIGENAFYDCTSLERADILNPNVVVGANAFYGVLDVQYDGDDPKAPWGAKALNAFIDADGLAYADSSRRMLVGCPADREGTVELPATVEAVDDFAFAGCNLLTRIVFLQTNTPLLLSPNMFGEDQPPENLLEIVSPNTDDYGVTYTSKARTSILFCNRISEGNVPVAASVRALCDYAFANCENVTVTFEEAPEFDLIGKDALFNTVNYNNWLNGSSDVFTIQSGNYTYILDAKENLTSYSIPAGTRCIAAEAFNRCADLGTVNLMSSALKSIGKRAFRNCAFSTLAVGEAVRSALRLNYIGSDVFNTETYCKNAGNTINGLTYFCGCLVRAEKNCSGDIEESTALIADGAFRDCTFTCVTVPEGVTRIGREAFAGCVNLTTISLPSTLKTIGDYAFRDCSALTEISLPAGLSSLGMYAFFNCSALEAIHATGTYDLDTYYLDQSGVLFRIDGDSASLIQYPPAKAEEDLQYAVPAFISGCPVTYLENFCFRRCLHLNNISHGDGIRYGYKNPFEGCKHVNDQTSVYDPTDPTILVHVSVDWSGEDENGVYTVADKVTEIGANAFSGCVGVKKIVLGNSVRIIREEAFLNCTGLEEVVMNTTLEEIGDRAFMNCSALTEVSFPLRMTIIGVSAFENCTSLKKVTFAKNNSANVNSNMECIGRRAFCNCASDLTVQTTTLLVRGENLEQSLGNFLKICAIEPFAFHLHRFEETGRKNATCEAYGWVKYSCACGDQTAENLPARGHSFGAWIVVRIENGDVFERRSCACGKTEERIADRHPTVVIPQQLLGTPEEFVTSIFTFFFKGFFDVLRTAFRR